MIQSSHLLPPSVASPLKLPELWRKKSITLSNFLLHKHAVHCSKCQDGALGTKYETLNCPQSKVFTAAIRLADVSECRRTVEVVYYQR